MNIESVIREKLNDFGEYFISICENEEKKTTIRKSINNLPTYKIYIFLTYIDNDKMEKQTDYFVILLI